MLYMNNFYSIEEMDMYSFPPFEEIKMASVDRCDSVISGSLDVSVEVFKKEIFAQPRARESKSRPPTPPDNGPLSPIGPERLRSLIPPPNYGTVDIHKIYRSSFPQDRNMDFMKTLKIRSVLTLVDTEPSPAFQQWMIDNNIQQLKIDIVTNKDGKVKTTFSSICQALLFVEDSNNWPLYIHCNQGKHRTGCVVACLRKIQRLPMDDIIDEYRVYAGAKARDGDIEFIKSFDPKRHELARRNSGSGRILKITEIDSIFQQEKSQNDEVMSDYMYLEDSTLLLEV